MFILGEYSVSLLVIVTGVMLLFMACVVVLVLIEGVGILAHTFRKIPNGAIQPDERWMRAESRES